MTDSVPPSYAAKSSLPPPPGVRHVIAVIGGRGGVGSSCLAINLAVYLAQLGRRVLLIDADPTGAQLHTMLGLVLLPQGYRLGSTQPIRPGRKPRWARGIRQLDVDYVLLDLGSGTMPST